MMSYRQIEANRRNALLSTGPKTETGKKASRRNALRHGLTALTRYETALWHQTYQLIFVLDYLRRRNLDLKWAPRALPFSGRVRPLRSMFPKG